MTISPQPDLGETSQRTVSYLFEKQRAFPIASTRAVTVSQAIAEFLILDMKPLSTVEGEGFKNLLKVLEPRYSTVSRNHILEKYIVPMYHRTFETVKLELSNGLRHAFTTDGWTSISTESFITTTCHFISPETYQLQSRVLDTKFCPVSHTAENLASEMLHTIEKWGLKDPVSVTDNAANIVKACEVANLPHIGCFGHILNLAVNRCLSVTEVNALIGKCRKLVSVFKQSSLKTTALHVAEANLDLKQLQVLQDVETRWNSALFMVKRLLEILPAIWAVLYKDKKHGHLLPSDSDRKNMEDLKDLLEPVEEATKKVSAEKSSTVSLILPTLQRFVNHDFVPKPTDSSLIVKAKTAIRNDLTKRYLKDDEQLLLATATTLDPRFKKLKWFEPEKRQEVYQLLKEAMIKEVRESTLSSVQIKTEQELPSQVKDDICDINENSPEKKRPKQEDNEIAESTKSDATDADFFDVLFVKEEKPEVTQADIVMKEFNGYMEDEAVSFKQDPIEWWCGHREKYPVLAQIALQYLHIPATSVPSERVFSTTGNILTKKRSSLTADNTDMMVFLYHNYHRIKKA
jgi:hypothetical protein